MPDNVTPIVWGFAGYLPIAMLLVASEINVPGSYKKEGGFKRWGRERGRGREAIRCYLLAL